jgi:hypothetical protein
LGRRLARPSMTADSAWSPAWPGLGHTGECIAAMRLQSSRLQARRGGHRAHACGTTARAERRSGEAPGWEGQRVKLMPSSGAGRRRAPARGA